MPSYNSTHTGSQIDTCVDTYQNVTDVQDIVAEAIRQAKLAMYPVGSIYMSISSTDPGTFIGGTWERIEDTFLLAAGSTYTAGATGGQAQVSHTHQHGMRLGGFYGATTFENNSGIQGALSWDSAGNKTVPAYTRWDTPSGIKLNSAATTALQTQGVATYDLIGNTSYTSISTLPPYLVVYVWRRIA